MAESEKGSKRLKEWIESTAKLLVDEPDKVRVEEVLSPDGSTSYFSIYCQLDDQGKVVGKKGANVDAIRRLSFAIGMALYKRRVEITVYNSGAPRDGYRR